jgi:hypothetical protein
LETVNELSLENQGRSPLNLSYCLKSCLPSTYLWRQTNMNVCEPVTYYWSFFLVNPDPLPENRRRERIHPKILWNPFWHLKSTSILLVFFWKPLSLPSVDAVFTCLSWNLLSKSPFSKYGKCEYNILLLRFLLSSYHLFNLFCGPTTLYCFSSQSILSLFYILSVRIFVDVFHFLVCLLILLYIPSSHHIYLFNHWQAQLLYFYESLWLRGLQPYHGIQH